MDFDLVPDFDAHQVFAHFQRSGISFSGVRHQVWSVERHDMGIDRQLWFHLAENLSWPVPAVVWWLTTFCFCSGLKNWSLAK